MFILAINSCKRNGEIAAHWILLLNQELETIAYQLDSAGQAPKLTVRHSLIPAGNVAEFGQHFIVLSMVPAKLKFCAKGKPQVFAF